MRTSISGLMVINTRFFDLYLGYEAIYSNKTQRADYLFIDHRNIYIRYKQQIS